MKQLHSITSNVAFCLVAFGICVGAAGTWLASGSHASSLLAPMELSMPHQDDTR